MHLFLHGFLGQKEDWDPLFSHLSSKMLAIDLPGHGSAPMADDIALAVKKQVPEATSLIGYSAGGRLALELKARFPNDYGRVIVLSSHPGLTDAQEKERRWAIDQAWINLLKEAPFEQFLDNWYNQELFVSLRNSSHFTKMLELRKKQHPDSLAQFLHNFSVAKKTAPKIFPETIFIHGKEDLKYEKLYRTLARNLKIFSVQNASHAVHLENPKACATIIQEVINEYR